MDDRVTRVAWLNRSTILYAGNDKWSIDDRVVILTNTKTQYSIKIHNVDIYDEGPYTCSVQTDNHPKTSRVHLIVQGKIWQRCLRRKMFLCGQFPWLQIDAVADNAWGVRKLRARSDCLVAQ